MIEKNREPIAAFMYKKDALAYLDTTDNSDIKCIVEESK
jgi:hypothetical protein